VDKHLEGFGVLVVSHEDASKKVVGTPKVSKISMD